ncbi:hypothetical protein NFI96_032075 [Prochilodus magdalenae]|nr:hypothetical protein NFI96_032075 [Prochilodus magdalenae]
MGGRNFIRKSVLLLLVLYKMSLVFTIEVCSNTILPGSKEPGRLAVINETMNSSHLFVTSERGLVSAAGDPGEVGDEGDEGRLGKTGPPGHRGPCYVAGLLLNQVNRLPGENGEKGEPGQMGKMGPAGERGEKGAQGIDGPSGLKGRAVILGIKEMEEKFYLLVKEARRYRDALMNCRLRGGTLAMPKSMDTNKLLTGYVSEAGLTHVFIGLQPAEAGGGYVYVDGSPLKNSTIWGLEVPSEFGSKSCVQMGSTGAWSQVECDVTKYFICEFSKKQ